MFVADPERATPTPVAQPTLHSLRYDYTSSIGVVHAGYDGAVDGVV